jgi:hypothetical protein
VQTAPSQLRPELSPTVDRLLLSALEFDTAKRPASVQQFGLEIAKLLRAAPAVEVGRRALNGLEVPVARPESPIPPTVVSTPIQPIAGQRIEYHEGEELTRPRQVKSKKSGLWLLLAVPILGVLALIAGIAILYVQPWSGKNKQDTGPNVNAGNETSKTEAKLSYYLLVQKMRDGKPFQEPFQSSGHETLESGYKFRMVFQTEADGFMYVYNEGKDAQGRTGYYLLFPTPNVNGGSAQVTKGKQIETAQNTLNGGIGTEVMWLIWTKEGQNDLETIMKSAVDQHGAVKAETAASLQSFLDKYKAEKPESIKDSASQRTVVKAKGDTVVHRFEIEHR